MIYGEKVETRPLYEFYLLTVLSLSVLGDLFYDSNNDKQVLSSTENESFLFFVLFCCFGEHPGLQRDSRSY